MYETIKKPRKTSNDGTASISYDLDVGEDIYIIKQQKYYQ